MKQWYALYVFLYSYVYDVNERICLTTATNFQQNPVHICGEYCVQRQCLFKQYHRQHRSGNGGAMLNI